MKVLLVLLGLATTGCANQRCYQVLSGWTYPELAPDGTRNMVRYSVTTFTVCQPSFAWR